MRRPARPLAALLTLGLLTANAMAAQEFSLEYRVERRSAADLSLDTCADIARREAAAVGYSQSVQRFPNQLAVVSGGPRGGGGSYVVYCITVDDKTVQLVQAIDYQNRAQPAAEFADRVHKALLATGR